MKSNNNIPKRYIVKKCSCRYDKVRYYLKQTYKFKDVFECQFCGKRYVEDKGYIDKNYNLYIQYPKEDLYRTLIFQD